MEQIIGICIETALIPLVIHIYSKRSMAIAEAMKKIVDLERAVTKLERDKQYQELKNESARLRMEFQHGLDEINQTLALHKNTFDRMFSKMDKIEDRK
jgi:hypothetical protein